MQIVRDLFRVEPGRTIRFVLRVRTPYSWTPIVRRVRFESLTILLSNPLPDNANTNTMGPLSSP